MYGWKFWCLPFHGKTADDWSHEDQSGRLSGKSVFIVKMGIMAGFTLSLKKSSIVQKSLNYDFKRS